MLLSILDGTSDVRLLYVTPEKVARSDVLMRMLDQLNQQQRLDRVVVDEAHCVSQVSGTVRGYSIDDLIACCHQSNSTPSQNH